MVDAVRYVGLEVPSFHNNGLLDEPRAPPSAVGPMCCGGRTLLQCLFVTQARWHQLTKEYDLREEAVVGGGEPRRLTALVGRGPKPTVFAHAWAQTDLTIGHLVGEGGEADPLGDMCMMESADCRVGFRPTHRGGVPVAREASVGVDVLSLREGGEADPLGDMCPLGREGDLDVMDVLDREGDPDVTDVHRHGGGPVPRLVAHWLGSCEVSDPSWFHSSSADSSGPKGPMWAFFQQKLLHIVSFPEDAGAFVPAQGCERCLHGLTLVDPLEIGVEVSTKRVGTVAHGCFDWRPDEEVVPVLLPSGDRAHVGVGTTIEARHAPGRPAVQDPAFAETCAWAVRASVDRGDHSGLLEGSMEDPWERDPEAPWEDYRYRGGGGGGRGIADLLLDDHERHYGPIVG